jgi:hypothetical protein
MEITLEIAMKIISKKVKLNQEGLYKNLKVTGVYLYKEGDDKKHENMIGYIYVNAFNVFDLEKIKGYIREDEYEEATGVSASFTIWENAQYIPRKGERIDAQVVLKEIVNEETGEVKTGFFIDEIMEQREVSKEYGINSSKVQIEEEEDEEEVVKKKKSVV